MNDPMNDQVNDHTNDPMNDVDWWASRLVDLEIAFADVPADLRGAVQRRADEFGRQRLTLQRSGVEHHVDPELTERAIAAASSSDGVVVPLRRRLAPLAAVAAASIGVIVLGVSVLGGDDRPDVIAEKAPTATTPDVAVSPDVRPEAAPSAAADAMPPVDETTSAMSVDTSTPDALVPEATTPEPSSRQAPMPTEITEIADMIELATYLEQWRNTPPAFLEGPAACEDDEGRPAVAVNVRFAGIDAQAYYSPEAGVMLLAVADCLKLASIVP